MDTSLPGINAILQVAEWIASYALALSVLGITYFCLSILFPAILVVERGYLLKALGALVFIGFVAQIVTMFAGLS